MKRIMSLSLSAIMLLTLFVSFTVFAQPDTYYDIVFAVDDSVQMQTSDANKAVAGAISEVLAQIPADGGVRVGVVGYGLNKLDSLQLTDVNEQNLTGIDTFLKTRLTRAADGKDYSVGLTEANTMLASSQNKNIVLVTAGANDYKASGRTAETTAADTAAAVQGGYPIYVVGINVPADVQQTLADISANTSATVNFAENDDQIKAALTNVVSTICPSVKAAPTLSPEEEAKQDAKAAQEQAVKTVSLAMDVGKEKTTTIEVYNQAKSGNVKITHSGELDLKLTNPSGEVITLGAGMATLSKGDGYTQIHFNNPIQGKWLLSITDSVAESITLASSFEYKLHIAFTNLQNVIYSGVDTTYLVKITSDDDLHLDLTNLKVNLFIESPTGTEYKDMTYRNGKYECTYNCESIGNTEISAVVVLDEGNVRSNPMSVMVVANPDEKSSLGLWIKITLLVIVFAFLAAIAIKNRRAIGNLIHLKKMEGVLGIEIKQNTVQPMYYKDLSEFGRKKSLYDIVQNRSLIEILGIQICGVSNGIKVISTGASRIRYTHVSTNPDGVIVKYGQGFKVFLGDNRTEIMLKYFEEMPGEATENTEEEPVAQVQSAEETVQTVSEEVKEEKKEIESPVSEEPFVKFVATTDDTSSNIDFKNFNFDFSDEDLEADLGLDELGLSLDDVNIDDDVKQEQTYETAQSETNENISDDESEKVSQNGADESETKESVDEFDEADFKNLFGETNFDADELEEIEDITPEDIEEVSENNDSEREFIKFTSSFANDFDDDVSFDTEKAEDKSEPVKTEEENDPPFIKFTSAFANSFDDDDISFDTEETAEKETAEEVKEENSEDVPFIKFTSSYVNNFDDDDDDNSGSGANQFIRFTSDDEEDDDNDENNQFIRFTASDDGIKFSTSDKNEDEE